ncbi:MAG: radical SAM protein [Chitinispirillaceae bacterium]|nr:radical SAM protein [Chitinispirillaceae bacterium]
MRPLLLHYFITNRCNSRCRFCSIWSEMPKTDETKENVFRNLKTARRSGCRFVDFTGGEPLLHPDLPLFLAEAKKYGYITSVTTNCILFPSRVGELDGRIDLLHFSLDADTPEVHNALRGSASFEKVIESIPLALRHHLVPDLLFTYTDDNIDSFEGVYRIARKYRLIALLDPVFSINGADTVSRTTHLKALRLAAHKGVYLNKAHLSLRFAGGNRIRKPVCRAVDSTIVIIPGSLRALPCFHHRCTTLPFGAELQSREHLPEIVTTARLMQGKYPFCEGCHINCYFDPSYNYLHNRLFFQSLSSKFSYIITKYFIYGHVHAFFKLYYHTMISAVKYLLLILLRHKRICSNL